MAIHFTNHTEGVSSGGGGYKAARPGRVTKKVGKVRDETDRGGVQRQGQGKRARLARESTFPPVFFFRNSYMNVM